MSTAPSDEGEEAVAGPEAGPDSSSLCVSCGMCCNGVLFTNARAQPEEVPRIRSLGVEVEQVEGGRLQFRLPCPHQHDGRCGIYADRFHKCRTFRCALLKRLDSGEETLAEAKATVAQAKAMLARVTALDPAAGQVSFRVEQRTAPLPAEGKELARRRRLQLESLALELFFDRKFRNTKAVVMNRLPGKREQEEQ